jgi:hypothetical protein
MDPKLAASRAWFIARMTQTLGFRVRLWSQTVPVFGIPRKIEKLNMTIGPYRVKQFSIVVLIPIWLTEIETDDSVETWTHFVDCPQRPAAEM